ncbi:fimbrial protein [Bacteroides sp. 519]|uniref:fimbrial tip adhesin FimD n=1 Tax=Bacteroides sp. 519 TaxID=2302937 RepID=UPI0013D43D78|nr:fimbrial protein [Bacteroides sp. 519]NDV59335.1 hypothetical protein [Bacteroides sp. 519]
MKQLLILFFVFIFTGCTNDNVSDINETNGQTVVFSLINTDQNATTRSTPGEESLNENTVQRLDVFFFNQAGQCLFYPSESQIDKVGSTVKITVPTSVINQITDQNIKLYVVANCNLTRNTLNGKAYNQLIETVHGAAQDFNPYPFVPQTSFLMDGILSVDNLTTANTNLGEVSLNRAASKVKVIITGANVNGYTPVEAHVRISNYLEQTSLGQEAPLYNVEQGDYKRSEYRPIWIPGSGKAQFDADPFYSYANNWEYGDSQESYITIRVKWYKNTGGAEPKDYFYRIPFNYIVPSAEEDEHFCLKRNYIYTFKVNIGALGGLDPDEMIELTPDFEIKDWTTSNIVTKLSQYDYLVVSETSVEMHDITQKSIQYISSQPVSVEMGEVFHYTYLSSGTIRKDVIDKNDIRYPTVTVNKATNHIDISSPVPVNYVPTMMEFRVRNTKGLYQDVYVIQYPRQYITSIFSNLSDIDFAWYTKAGFTTFWSNDGNGNSTMKNFNLYTVTTTSVNADDDFVIGGDFMTTEYNSTLEVWQPVTKKDPDTSRMVSPKFVIASQRGITSISTGYTTAQTRCANYMEGGYGPGTWRIPTVAEMLLISRLQRDGNSAIKDLFIPAVSDSGLWWAAQQGVESDGYTYYHSVQVTTGEVVRTRYESGFVSASVRCVHDVWKD